MLNQCAWGEGEKVVAAARKIDLQRIRLVLTTATTQEAEIPFVLKYFDHVVSYLSTGSLASDARLETALYCRGLLLPRLAASLDRK
jgi:hypothetical protein